MIDYSKAIMKKKIDKVVKALEENNIKAYRISSREEMFEVLETRPPKKKALIGVPTICISATALVS